MFARIFNPEVKEPPRPRIQDKPEFAPVFVRMQQLRVKAAAFYKDAAGDISTLHSRKYEIFNHLLQQLEDQLKAFNEAKRSGNPSDEIRDMIRLALKMANIIKETIDRRNPTLNEHRNPGRVAMVKGSVDVVSYGSLYAAATAASFGTLGLGATLLFAGPRVSQKAKEMVGVDNIVPQSFTMLTDFHSLLQDLANNLSLKLNLQEDKNRPKTEVLEGFLCPINYTLMSDPVTFFLDGQTYERSALLEALRRKPHVSPYDGREMTPEQMAMNIDDLIKPNFALRSAIEDFKKRFPEHCDAESQNQVPEAKDDDPEVRLALNN
ncbi:MAG: U-box domain-containing protein [Gammaproteobacteria bacterium]